MTRSTIAYSINMPVDALVLLVYALAITRVTGLITQDAITDPIRDRLISSLDDRPNTLGSAVSTLISCPWCASVWIAAIATPLIWWHGYNPILLIPALWFAFSQVAGMTSQIGR